MTLVFEKTEPIHMPSCYGNFSMIVYKEISTQQEHFIVYKGDLANHISPLIRIHSSCITGDILGSYRCDCGEQLEKSLQLIEQKGTGMVIYLQQEGRGIGLFHKMKAYKLQENGYDTVEANIKLGFQADERNYDIAVHILKELSLTNISLISNNPIKKEKLEQAGFVIDEMIALHIPVNDDNKKYMMTKKTEMNHILPHI